MARAAIRLCDYGYVMEGGRIVLHGTREQLENNQDVKEFYLGRSLGEGRKGGQKARERLPPARRRHQQRRLPYPRRRQHFELMRMRLPAPRREPAGERVGQSCGRSDLVTHESDDSVTATVGQCRQQVLRQSLALSCPRRRASTVRYGPPLWRG